MSSGYQITVQRGYLAVWCEDCGGRLHQSSPDTLNTKQLYYMTKHHTCIAKETQ